MRNFTICLCWFSLISSQVFVDETNSWLPEDLISKCLDFGDIDNDGDLDIVSGKNELIQILYNVDNQYYELGYQIMLSNYILDIKLVDVNNDSNLDILAINVGQDRLFINYLPDFIDETEIRLPVVYGSGVDMDIGDIDNDGDIDYLLAASTGIETDNDQLYINYTGNGNFVDATSYFIGLLIPHFSFFKNVSLHDSNNDGKLDLWFGFYNTPWWINSTYSALIINNESGGWNDEYVHFYNYVYINSYDINDDGKIDIFAVDSTNQMLSLWINYGNTNFQDETEIRLGDNSFTNVEAGDFNNDGFPELICNHANQSFEFYLNDQYGNFINITEEWLPEVIPSYFSDLKLFDIDGDGDLDLYHFDRNGVNDDQILINTYNNGGAVSYVNTTIDSFTPGLSNGIDSIGVIITLKDELNNPLSGRYVKLIVEGGGLEITQPLRPTGGVTTDLNGQVIGRIKSTIPGVKKVKIIANDLYLTTVYEELLFLSEPLYGDINADFVIDVLDIIIMINIILNTGFPPSEYQILSADLNNDGVIDVLDVVMIVNVILE
ncbi:MAG: VCBS repeat-containing protein [Candidatus Pelagibacter sp.]|nr:VCBS repeat-containing protein [Candidatus Pelagibacter sp.]